MFNPFRLKQSIGEEYNMNLDDSLKTKKALADLGHMEVPDHGLTEFPDRSMIEGVKSFQRDQGLKEDGIIKPDGPTIRRLNETLAAKQKMAKQPSRATTVVSPRQSNPPRPKPKTLFQHIRLKRPITAATSVDLNDTGRVKSALNDLGLLNTRDLPLDAFPDQSMIEGIKTFQRENSLREDGEMKPGGETVERLNQVMAAREQEQSTKAENGTPQGMQVAQISDDKSGQGVSAMSMARSIAKTLLGATVAKEAQKEKATPPAIAGRSILNEPFPPNPGLLPLKDEDQNPIKTEFPASPPELPKLEGRPINEILRNEPMIFQELSDEIKRELTRPWESHRGDPVTQMWNSRVANVLIPKVLNLWGPDAKKDVKHVGGATDSEGERIPEEHLRNQDIPLGQDGRKGSSNPDLTLEHTPTDKKIHFNTGKTLKDGRTGISIERKSAERLAKNVGEDLSGFLPKYRPGMDIHVIDEVTMEILKEIFTEVLGPPL